MKHSRFAVRALASALLATSLLSVTAFAAPADASSTAVRVNKGSSTLSSVEAVNGTQSPVPVTPDHAEGSFEVIYQSEIGGQSSATITAVAIEGSSSTITATVGTPIAATRSRDFI